MPKEMVDYYKVLDIDKEANDIEIRKAYNKKIAEYKEKKRNGEQVETKKIIRAYEVLLDKENRAYYDECLEEYYESLKNKTKLDYFLEDIEEKVSNDYKSIKEKEKKNSFKKRHERSEKFLKEEYGKDIDSIPKWIAFKTKKGLLHITGEFVYQVNNLIPRKKDDASRYVIRNRKVILGVIIGGAIITGLNTNKVKEANSNSKATIETTDTTKPVKYYYLNKIYVVQSGDTLSELAEKKGVSMSRIESVSELNTSLLYIGQKIKIPYEIDEDELYEYTKIVDAEGKTLKELASIYETDVETLEELNKNYIMFDYDRQSLVSISDTILVPNFSKIEKTSKEYQYIKEN